MWLQKTSWAAAGFGMNEPWELAALLVILRLPGCAAPAFQNHSCVPAFALPPSLQGESESHFPRHNPAVRMELWSSICVIAALG